MRIILLSLFDEWCMGLRSLSAVLRRDGHETAIVHLGSHCDGQNDDGYYGAFKFRNEKDYDLLLEAIGEFKPELVGISLASENFGFAKDLTARLRADLGLPIVWGGIDPTANPDLAIEAVDIVCVGEGEGALLDLVERLGSGRPYADVPNLWVREGQSIHRNAVRTLIQDLDTLPWPDFETRNKYYIFNGTILKHKYADDSPLQRLFPIMGARGCPSSCTYCCNAMLRDLYGAKGYVRERSIPNVLGEIEEALRRNPRIEMIGFWDDVFGVRRGTLREFADTYPKRIGMPFYCYVHPRICDRERVDLLKRAGVAFVTMGIQSGSERVLREVYNRNTPRDKILNTSRLLHEAGIPMVVDIIGNNPLETEEDYRESLDLLLSLPPGFCISMIGGLSVYRNFPIADILEKAGFPNVWSPDGNWAGAVVTPTFRFWNSLLGMTEFEHLDGDALRSMADDPYLREHPEIVESLFKALRNSVYFPGTNQRRGEVHGAEHVELARLKGSRLVRGYLGVKKLLRRVSGKGRRGFFSSR